MKIRVRLRTGDKAIIVGVAAIAAYEKIVHDDEDLISSRVSAYKRAAPMLTIGVVAVTAGHLLEWINPQYDPYRWLVRYFRRSAAPPPQPEPQRYHQ